MFTKNTEETKEYCYKMSNKIVDATTPIAKKTLALLLTCGYILCKTIIQLSIKTRILIGIWWKKYKRKRALDQN